MSNRFAASRQGVEMSVRHASWVAITVVFTSVCLGQERSEIASASLPEMYFPPPGESLDMQSRRSPAEVGLSADFIDGLKPLVAGRWALWRNGYLVHVAGDFHTKGDVASLRKTWHALTVGAAIKQNKIPTVTERISVWAPGLQGVHAEATWWHVITQTSGFDYPYGPWPAYRPGEIWTYSDKNPRVLCYALARVYGKKDFHDEYADVVRQAYFDAIGLRGWRAVPRQDGIRFHFDLEDMGRLGLLILNRGRWAGREIIPQWFVEQLERKQTGGIGVNYDGPDDGKIDLDPKRFPEAPYGFMTWVNTDGEFYPGADRAWAWAAGAGGTRVLWSRNNGIVFAAFGADKKPSGNGIPQVIERSIISEQKRTAGSTGQPTGGKGWRQVISTGTAARSKWYRSWATVDAT